MWQKEQWLLNLQIPFWMKYLQELWCLKVHPLTEHSIEGQVDSVGKSAVSKLMELAEGDLGGRTEGGGDHFMGLIQLTIITGQSNITRVHSSRE